MTETGRLLPIAAAADAAGVPERTLRRWIERGTVPATSGPRGRLVELADVRRVAALAEAGRTEPATAGHDLPSDRTLPATAEGGRPDGLAELAAVIDRLTRENLELAGRCGYLQAQLAERDRAIAQLTAPAPAPTETATAETTNHPTTVENGPGSGAQRVSERAGRPWWAFWRPAPV